MSQVSNNTIDSNNTVYVFIDYFRSSLWGAWFSKHSWCERAIQNKLPNIMNSNPICICETAKQFLRLHGKNISFVFSDAVKFLHQVESRSI